MNNPISKFFSWIFGNRKRAVVFLLTVLVVAFVIFRFKNSSTITPQYQTEAAQKGVLVTSVSSSGTITNGGSVDITTSATGIVNTVYVQNGDMVTAGQKIAEITLDQSSQQRQAAAWSSYLSAQNSLNSNLSKQNSLQSALFKANQTFVNGMGVANPIVDDPKYIEQKAEWLAAEADYKNQQNVIAQSQAAVSSSWFSYSQSSSTVTAPSSGIITNLTIAPGVVISSSSNTSSSISSNKLGNVADPSAHTQATVSLSEVDVSKVKAGQKVVLSLDSMSGKTFSGKILIVNTNGQVSSGVTTYPAVIVFDESPKGIYPNMAVTAKIITNIKDNVLLVPSVAIQSNNGQTTIRLMKDNQISSVDVVVGDSNDSQTEVVSGISEGDVVVTSVTNPGSTATSTNTTSVFGGGLGGNRSGFGGGQVRIQGR